MLEENNQESNNNKRRHSLVYYCMIAILILMLLNTFVFPVIFQQKVTEVGYNDFLTMIDNG